MHLMRAMLPPEVSCSKPGARSVWRPTERSGHEVTTSRDQEACPQSLHVVTLESLHVVAGHYM